MRRCLIILITIFSLFFVSQTYAHYLWLNVDNYNPNPNEEIAISLGWGHKFCESGQPRAEMVEKIKLFLIEPDGKKVPLKIGLKGEKVEPIKVRLKKRGVYLAVATIKTFVSKTVEGYFYKPKNELKDVLKSKWSETTAVAIINVGKPHVEAVLKPIEGSNYQILPLKNPGALAKGEILPVRVMLKGKPFRTWVFATYAGFSEFKDTFAWTTKTDKKGVARVKILKKGIWLVKTDAEMPFSDPKKADVAHFIATLTFGL